MKKYFNKMSIGIKAVSIMAMGLIVSLPAFAQATNLGQEVIDQSAGALYDLLNSVVTLIQIVMGLGAIVVLGMVIFKVFKGDREAAEKLAWWVAGLTIGFVLLTVVSGLIPSA